MMTFNKTITNFNTPNFNDALKEDILQLDQNKLPLQQALAQSSYLSDTKISVVILNSKDNETEIIAKVGVFFFGIIAGSCCADDPTPVDDLQEYCELEFLIDKGTAVVTVNLLDS